MTIDREMTAEEVAITAFDGSEWWPVSTFPFARRG